MILGYDKKENAEHRICKICKEEVDKMNKYFFTESKKSLVFGQDSQHSTTWLNSLEIEKKYDDLEKEYNNYLVNYKLEANRYDIT